MINHFKNTILSIAILPLLSLFASANLEQKLLSINTGEKKVTLTLFHFNASVGKASIIPVVDNLGSTIAKLSGKAGITIPQNSGVTIVESKIIINPTANFLVKDGAPIIVKGSDTFSKHTFILSNGKGSFALGYAPLTSKQELTFAIQQYVKSNKFNFNTAVLLSSGNHCAFYKDNGDYHSYYLKELDPAKKSLIIK